MTEDDTFRKLKRTSLKELMSLSDDIWYNSFGVGTYHERCEQYKRFVESHHWNYQDFVNARNYHD